MSTGVTIVIVAPSRAGRCSPQRVRELATTPLFMVVALGSPPKLHVPVGVLATPPGWPMPTPQPGDPAQDASTIAYAIEDARRVAPGAPVELLLFTDPALDGVRLRGVDPSIRVRHDSAPVTPAATPVGNPRRTPVPVIPLVVGALALGLAVGGVGMWLTGRGQNPAPVDGDRSTYDVNVTLSESDGRLTGQVAYPQLSCSGEWVETTRTSAMIILTETIAVGTERCVRTVTINMLPGDDEVLIWFSSPAGQTISSHMRRA